DCRRDGAAGDVVVALSDARLLWGTVHHDGEFSLDSQLSVVRPRSEHVSTRLGERRCRDRSAIFHWDGREIKGDGRRPAPHEPIDHQPLRALSPALTASAGNRWDVDWYFRLVG